MRTRREKARAAFTLIELMMVVAILGILAMFAIPRYKSYLYRSKVAEGIAFLSEIKSRQESYRADFGQYCSVMAGQSSPDYYPTAQNAAKQYVWDSAPTTGYGAGYRQLGAYPPSQTTLFQYQVLAGPPGAGNVPTNVPGYTGDDFWFVSRARADLDGNGSFMLLEGYSASSNIYNDQPKGYE